MAFQNTSYKWISLSGSISYKNEKNLKQRFSTPSSEPPGQSTFLHQPNSQHTWIKDRLGDPQDQVGKHRLKIVIDIKIASKSMQIN